MLNLCMVTAIFRIWAWSNSHESSRCQCLFGALFYVKHEHPKFQKYSAHKIHRNKRQTNPLKEKCNAICTRGWAKTRFGAVFEPEKLWFLSKRVTSYQTLQSTVLQRPWQNVSSGQMQSCTSSLCVQQRHPSWPGRTTLLAFLLVQLSAHTSMLPPEQPAGRACLSHFLGKLRRHFRVAVMAALFTISVAKSAIFYGHLLHAGAYFKASHFVTSSLLGQTIRK